MSDYCKPLKKQDPAAHTICEYLQDHGYTLDQVDQGYTRPDFDFSDGKSSGIIVQDSNGRSTNGNGVPEPPEIYRVSIQLVEEAFAARGKATFCGGGKFNDYITFLQDHYLEEEIPFWIPVKGTGDAAADEKLCNLLSSEEKKDSHELYDFFRTDLQLDFSDPGGFRETSDIFEELAFNCIESFVFDGVQLLLGRKSIPLDTPAGDHLFRALKLNPKKPEELTFVDFAKEEKGFGFVPDEKDWVEISKNDLFAYAEINRAFPASDADRIATDKKSREFQKKKLDHAARYAPQNYVVRYAIGLYFYLGGDWESASKAFEESLKLNPFYEMAKEPF